MSTLTYPITLSLLIPNEGELYVGAIISAGLEKRHHIFLLPDELVDADWQSTMDWAAGLNASLPDRCESALLFATMRAQFARDWYWTNTQHAADSDYAWFQDFNDGDQDDTSKSCEMRARVVRRLEIQ